jgi:hypothetical protein
MIGDGEREWEGVVIMLEIRAEVASQIQKRIVDL